MPRPKKSVPAQTEAKETIPNRITVNVAGFEKRLRAMCNDIDRSEGDLGRSVLRAALDMYEREGRISFPLRFTQLNEDVLPAPE